MNVALADFRRHARKYFEKRLKSCTLPFMSQDLSPFTSPDNARVLFACTSDEDARRISGVLLSLGFAPRRVTNHSLALALRGALDRVLRRHGVEASRERVVALMLLDGYSTSDELTEHFSKYSNEGVRLSVQTLKWLRRSLLARCHVQSVEAFLALVHAEVLLSDFLAVHAEKDKPK